MSGGSGVNLVLDGLRLQPGLAGSAPSALPGRPQRRRQGRHHRLRRRRRLDRAEQRRRHVPTGQLRARRLRLPRWPGRRDDHDRLPHPRRRPERRLRAARLRQEPQPATPRSPAGRDHVRGEPPVLPDHDADWFGKNPYLGCAVNANNGELRRPVDAHGRHLQLRSKPIPVEELHLPEVHLHILADSQRHVEVRLHAHDHPRRRHRAAAVQLERRTASRASFSTRTTATTTGSAPRLRPHPARDQAGHERVADRGDDRVQHARRRQELRHDARTSTSSTGSVRRRARTSRSPPTSPRARRSPTSPMTATTRTSASICRSRRSPSSCGTWSCRSSTSTSGRTRTSGSSTTGSRCSSAGQPYSWTVSGVVLDQDHHKHMGVYSGRAVPDARSTRMAPIMPDGQVTRTKDVSLAFVGQKLERIVQQPAGRRQHRIRSSSSSSFSSQDIRRPDTHRRSRICSHHERSTASGWPATGSRTARWARRIRTRISELGWFTTVFGIGVHLNDINTKSLAITVNPERQPDAVHASTCSSRPTARRRSPAPTTWTSSSSRSRCG